MPPTDPIVIVGSACRFPGGVNKPSELWDLLKDPQDLRSEIPRDRFNIDAFYHPDGSHPGRTNARHGYFLKENPRAFDASFFKIQANEAESIDPQQRMLLETTYDAFSAAGYRLHDLRGSNTAVYVGIMTHDFELVKANDKNYNPTYFATGAATSIASNRISYFFDWQGPSMTVDTACSSSLVAVHLAVQQLRSGNSTTAIAAGSNIILSPMNYITESKLKMLLPTDRSRMWDSAADGYARGEGVAVVILKTLSQALKDGDRIDCIIRETGVNQDGKTTGITMPSHAAQESLIRETYARAGLDITKHDDRCQFFEAHGTGTPAGDPQEAEAIANAFFGNDHQPTDPDKDTLFVGSLKTIIGHTEGTAGIAGLLKASLAVQHGVIPPNLLFENLSANVEPFYKHLRITKSCQTWPDIGPGQLRRASVNSFGFGGTNAHAIIEEYRPANNIVNTAKRQRSEEIPAYLLPLVFSAKSERALKVMMKDTAHFIKYNRNIDMLDLIRTLLSKRSILPYRRTIVGSSKETISLALDNVIARNDESTPNLLLSTADQEKPRLLGVFTGQGAQWSGMMKKLILAVPYVRDILTELDNSLQTLPKEYRPSWTLYEQFMLEGEDSNVGSAQFSQPLCCAVQIVLVRLLAAAGMKFTTVVGHSSGEIACAFAAGFVSASQAIRIAYLRGVISKHACSPSGKPGAMLAAGVSVQDAEELCELDMFRGRVCVAASNSPDSTTLSGDADAIAEIQSVLEDESKFVRILKVDKAYHSHHMDSCSLAYIEALKNCGCDVADASESATVWYSSVYRNRRIIAADVTAEYWSDNLVSPVRFMQAVKFAANTHSLLDAVIEVGCHPALKAPCLATLKTVFPKELPYTSCMQRGGNDMEAFASAIGCLWESLRPGAVHLDSFITKIISPGRSLQSLANDLPQYPWDHTRDHWTETRIIKAHLHGPRPHLLLGSLSPSSKHSSWQWHNTIRARDHEWLQGHALQGQLVFPAAGYVVMAMEAALQIADKQPVKVVEILNMNIDKAVTFEDEDRPVDLMITVNMETTQPDRTVLNFTIDSCLAKESQPSTSAKGQLVLTLGETVQGLNILPPGKVDLPHANNINTKNFYLELDELGYDYSKDYRCIYSLARADAKATGTMAFPLLADGSRSIVLHPASMDLAFQTIMGAYSAPGDKRMRSIYVPVHIDRITLVPSLCASALDPNSSEHAVRFETTNTYDKGDVLAGDVTVMSARNNNQVLYRVENLLLKPLSIPSASEDHKVFTKTVWGPLNPERLLDNPELWATEQDKEVIPIIERVCYFFMKEFNTRITEEDKVNATGPHQRYIYWNEHVAAEVKNGTWHEWYNPDWESDTREKIEQLCSNHWYHPHIRMAKRVSENALATIRENINPFLWMDHDGLLEEFYQSYLTSGPGWLYGQDLVDQICHRYQNMDILEIGGGTGSATKYILDIPQLGFNSYTFTDISPAFFEKAQEHFSKHEDRMIYKKLDITRSPQEQGFKPHSYDMIVASSVLHATPKLLDTMTNVRSLLKPGGHVVLLEATHRDHTRVGYLFGLFPDWWAGVDEGRDMDPFADIDQWDTIFKQTGFSGVDSRTMDRHGNLFPNTLFCTHAVNSLVKRLDVPLVEPNYVSPPLVVIGGSSAKSLHILTTVREVLHSRKVDWIERLEDILTFPYEPNSTFLVLSELDQETFSDMNEIRLNAIKALHDKASHIVWLTENAMTENPYQSMSIAFLRSTRLEYPNVHIQSVDVDNALQLDVTFLVEQILRLEEASGAKDGILWTQEPEVYISKTRPYIPRIKHDVCRNNRILSKRRVIEAPVNVQETCVSLEALDSRPYLQLSRNLHTPGTTSLTPTHVRVKVDFTMTNAIRVGDFGYWHLVQGTVLNTGEKIVALTDKHESIVDVNIDLLCDLPTDFDAKDNSILASVVTNLIAQNMAISVAPGASVLVLEPPNFCTDTILQALHGRNVMVYFASTQPCSTSSMTANWIRLHPYETDAGLKIRLPANLAAFYDMTDKSNACGNLGDRVSRHMAPGCLKFNIEHFVLPSAAPIFSSGHFPTISLIKETVWTLATKFRATSGGDEWIPRPINSITNLHSPLHPFSTIDWRSDGSIKARFCAIDSGKLFAQDKTYLLIGLAGSLGRSLARWLVTRGARHVVLSSRNPEFPDPKWLEEVESLGGKITVISIDVSKEASIEDGLAKIRQTLPPIAGIAYGPLVLHDCLLSNMDSSIMNVPVYSKVIGAKILHERFSDQASNPLDFFVMFSSVATVGGNPGQANYTAANAFLQALAQQRHANGLPASTIHIGAVIGVGYLARTQREEEFKLASDTDTISEDEFLTLFGEAVISGRTTSSMGTLDVTDTSHIEVITGIPEFSSRHKDTIKFYDDPRFGNLRIPENHTSLDGVSDGRASMKEQLLKARTLDEVRDIIIDGLVQKMRGVLHIPADEQINVTVPLVDQGVDSLGAITVGSWFSKMLFIDIPLLRVIGGASIAELAEEAARRLPRATIPLIEPEDGAVAVNESGKHHRIDSAHDKSGTGFVTDLRTDSDAAIGQTTVPRQVPLSISQEYSWKLLQQLNHDRSIFNNTIGVFMKGSVDLGRLKNALATCLQRHEIFRTAIHLEGVQSILDAPSQDIKFIPAENRAAAEEAYRKLETEDYDLAAGKTLKLVDWYWGQDEHLFVIGYHRLVGDGSTTQNFLNEVGQIYDGAQLSAPPQYSNFALRQRFDLETGNMDADIAYWTSMYSHAPPVLPVLSLPQAKPSRSATTLVAWKQHVGMLRLSPVLAFRIRERCKSLKGVTPMQFFLAAYRILLARLSKVDDMAIGIADTNRFSIQDISTMGFFANLLPVRMEGYQPNQSFTDELLVVKDRLRKAMQHACVPYSVTLARLGLDRPATELQHAPLFQAVFDYRQGAAETGRLGKASFTEIRASRERMPHDVVLEMSDDPAKDPLVTVKLQSYLYGDEDPRAFLAAYEKLLSALSKDPGSRCRE